MVDHGVSLTWRRLVVLILGALGMSLSAAPCEPSQRTLSTGEPRLAATIRMASAWAGVPEELLAAIAWVESGGRPLALNVGGTAFHPRTYAEAVALVRAVRGRADIGVAQIHYPLWGPVFGLRPEDLLDHWTNLHVAAAILRYSIDHEPGSWGGVGRYHSATPGRKWWYARQVVTVVRALRVPVLPPRQAQQP
jgi:hypothetical protein